MKLKTALLIFSLFCTPAIADNGSASQGGGIEINGQQYFKTEPTDASPSLYSRSNSTRNHLFSGDLLTDQSGITEYRASGSILVHADPDQAQELATEYGLNVVSNIGHITILKATPEARLDLLAKAIQGQGLKVHVELVNSEAQPE